MLAFTMDWLNPAQCSLCPFVQPICDSLDLHDFYFEYLQTTKDDLRCTSCSLPLYSDALLHFVWLFSVLIYEEVIKHYKEDTFEVQPPPEPVGSFDMSQASSFAARLGFVYADLPHACLLFACLVSQMLKNMPKGRTRRRRRSF
jgi:hypothetical protein